MSIAASKRGAGHRALRRLPRVLAIGVVVLFLTLLGYGLTTTAPDDSIDQKLAAKRSAPAPGFSLEVLNRGVLPSRLGTKLGPVLADNRLSLREVRGTPIVLNFWASWCEPCRAEAGELARTAQTYASSVHFLGMAILDGRDAGLAYMAKYKVPYPSVRDARGMVSRRFCERRGASANPPCPPW